MVLASSTLFAQGPRNRAGYDWAGFNRYAAANDSLTVSPKVVFIGDSITDFWADMRPEFFSSNDFLGRGIGAQSTANMLCRFQQDCIDLHPKVVVLLCGTNDVAQNNGVISKENVVAEIKSMCELARVHGIVPVVCSVLPCNRFYWREDMKPGQDIIELNKLLREYATTAGIIYCDYHSEMTLPDGSLPLEYSEDGCHPIAKGYEKMEEIVLPYIQKALAL